jgi:hypothetical protein
MEGFRHPPASSGGCDQATTAPGGAHALRGAGWSGALLVTVITVSLLLLDISNGSVHRYWSRHSFTSSVLSGVLVLLLTVLIIDRVTRNRQLRGRSRAIAAQAGIIARQADRALDAIKTSERSAEGRDVAIDELRTYTQMLLISAPVLIDESLSRAFLEAAQRLAAEVFWALRAAGDEDVAETRLDAAVKDLRNAAEPVVRALSRQELAAVSPGR